jgi:catechol 2,3-dioxygenase-like lactoylglutathione lyase family enzyme
MIDHLGINVADLERSIAFYERALAPLGYSLFRKIESFAAGFAEGGKPDFWLNTQPVKDRVHVAIRAKGRAEVRAFYEAAIAAS